MDLSGKEFHARMKMIASDANFLEADCSGSSSDASNQNLPSLFKDKGSSDFSHVTTYHCHGASNSNSHGTVNSPGSVDCDGKVQDLSYITDAGSQAAENSSTSPLTNAFAGGVTSVPGKGIAMPSLGPHSRGNPSTLDGVVNKSSCDVFNVSNSQGNVHSLEDCMSHSQNTSSYTNEELDALECGDLKLPKPFQNGHLSSLTSSDDIQPPCAKQSENAVEVLETRPKQRRKSRKPLKSSIRYVKAESDSPSSPNSELSPPPTLSSPSLPCTPPVSVQAPLSPPLSDVQSSISSLSPCSSINSDESKCGAAVRAPLPRLLPIDNWPTSAVHNKLPNKLGHSPRLKAEDQQPLYAPGSDELPPPPPYPKAENGNAISKIDLRLSERVRSNGNVSVDTNESHNSSELITSRTDISNEPRPPPPPYHSHFFPHCDKMHLFDSASDVSDSNSENSALCPSSSHPSTSPAVSDSFWSSVHLPSSLSVSTVHVPRDAQLPKPLCSDDENDVNKKEEDKFVASSTGEKSLQQMFPSSSVAMLLQHLSAIQNKDSNSRPNNGFVSAGTASERKDEALLAEALPVSEENKLSADSVAQENNTSSTINIDIDKDNLTSILNNLIAKNVSQPNGLTEESPNYNAPLLSKPESKTSSLASVLGSRHMLSQLSLPAEVGRDGSASPDPPERNGSPGASSPAINQAVTHGMDLSKEAGDTRKAGDDHAAVPPDNSATVAALVSAAMQNSFGLSNPLMSESSPLAALLAGNSAGDISRYASLFSPGNMDLVSLSSSLGMPSAPFGNPIATESKASASDKLKGAPFDKSMVDNPAMSNLGNMAALTYLLQQQQLQLESAGLSSGSTNVPPGLNGLATLPPLNGLAGLPMFPGLCDATLQQALKKMRYSGDSSMPAKRKPRSSNHTKSFHCSLCSKRFSLKDELEEHMLTHTSDELGNESYMQKSFACTECSFRTKYKFCLQRHMHIHSGEKPLVCPYCRYRSISKVSYDNHIRTHTGEKPFSCPYCSYKSSFKNNLTKHIKTHTGSSKPYTCNKCSCCFSSQMQLKTHMRLHMDPTGTHSCSQCLYTCMSRFELECHMRTHLPM
ncbi:Zinc finger C2H2-type [Trinorchestia longiramus]|nr:Zinc finger C2H2-type [Trinorchestia longiramus]